MILAYIYEDFDIAIEALQEKHPVYFQDHIGVWSVSTSSHCHAGPISTNKSDASEYIGCCEKGQSNEIFILKEDKAIRKEEFSMKLKHALWSANFEPAEAFLSWGEEIGLKGITLSYLIHFGSKTFWLFWLLLQIKPNQPTTTSMKWIGKNRVPIRWNYLLQ